jgi:hypothetical protein
MNAFAPFPARLHWNAQQLADAVPLRLSQMLGFERARDIGPVAAANREAPRPRHASGYLDMPALHDRFTVR